MGGPGGSVAIFHPIRPPMILGSTESISGMTATCASCTGSGLHLDLSFKTPCSVLGFFNYWCPPVVSGVWPPGITPSKSDARVFLAHRSRRTPSSFTDPVLFSNRPLPARRPCALSALLGLRTCETCLIWSVSGVHLTALVSSPLGDGRDMGKLCRYRL